jgi:hypothetical protein
MPSFAATPWMFSPESSLEMSARIDEFWRSRVSAAVTARLMPALSRSIETCMKTMPRSPIAMIAIHARPRTRRSSTRASPTRIAVLPRRSESGARPAAAPASAARGERVGPETRRELRGAGLRRRVRL